MLTAPMPAPIAASPSRGLAGRLILQVLPALETGGVERGTVEMAHAIAGAGGTALVASAGGRMVAGLLRAGGHHVALPLATRAPLAIWRNAALLEALIRAHDVALVHARSRAPAWSAWLACRRTGTPFVTTYHGVYGEDLPGKRLYNSVMARGQRVIAISHYVAERLIASHGVPQDRVRIIPRGVDPVLFDPDAISGERVMRLLRDWRLPEGARVVLLPGRLTRWKGQAVLIEALHRLGRRDVVAVLVGPDRVRRRRPGFAAELTARATTLGIADRLRITGTCDDMPAALSLADVVVHASTRPEAFGRVVIEAQAMRRPVIASDLGGPVETVDHGRTGWRVPPGDAGALAEMLAHALDLAPPERAALGQAARASVLAHYTTRAMQDATLAVYEELLG